MQDKLLTGGKKVQGGGHTKKTAKPAEKKLHVKGKKGPGKENSECYESTIVNVVL
ncbi:MAG: hypothetical protein PHN75_21115 [Syntrophales bacterium]|nr:hypothetical protein [Syntrophales bacterium]